MMQTKYTPERVELFCAALAETCNVGKACESAGIHRRTAYLWRDNHPEFDKRWDDALRVGVSALEDEAHRRAFDGVNKPVINRGQVVYQTRRVTDENGVEGFELVLDEKGQPIPFTVREYSDTLAVFLLKAHDPEKYRENYRVDLNGRLAVTDMSEEEIRNELAAMVAEGVVPPSILPTDPTNSPDDCSDLV